MPRTVYLPNPDGPLALRPATVGKRPGWVLACSADRAHVLWACVGALKFSIFMGSQAKCKGRNKAVFERFRFSSKKTKSRLSEGFLQLLFPKTTLCYNIQKLETVRRELPRLLVASILKLPSKFKGNYLPNVTP